MSIPAGGRRNSITVSEGFELFVGLAFGALDMRQTVALYEFP